MPTNWPPPTAPSWPPPELNTTWFSASNLKSFVEELLRAGFTHEAPTPSERNQFFRDARCDHDGEVVGRMMVSPSNVRYPIAMCTCADGHNDVLVLWPPYYCGAGSGNFELVG